LHEDAPEDQIYMRGAYFVNAKTSDKNEKLIDFFVLDPNYQVVYARRNHEEGIFRFNTTMPGQYSFVFSNMKDRVNKKEVTIAIHPGYNKAEVKTQTQIRQEAEEDEQMAKAAGVGVDEIQQLNSLTRKVLKSSKNLLTEAKMSMIR
jgi:hypothetical protein